MKTRFFIFLALMTLFPISTAHALESPWYWDGENGLEIKDAIDTDKGPAVDINVRDLRYVLVRPSVIHPAGDENPNYEYGWEFSLKEIRKAMHAHVGDEAGVFKNGKVVWKKIRSFCIEADEYYGSKYLAALLDNDQKPTYGFFLKNAFAGPEEYPVEIGLIPCGESKRKTTAHLLATENAGEKTGMPGDSNAQEAEFLKIEEKHWKTTPDGRFVFLEFYTHESTDSKTMGSPENGTYVIDGNKACFLAGRTIYTVFYIKNNLFFFDSDNYGGGDAVDWDKVKGKYGIRAAEKLKKTH